MTNSTQSQWEVAGSKKVKGYDSDSKRTFGMTTRNSKSNLSASKIPVVETLSKENSTTNWIFFISFKFVLNFFRAHSIREWKI